MQVLSITVLPRTHSVQYSGQLKISPPMIMIYICIHKVTAKQKCMQRIYLFGLNILHISSNIGLTRQTVSDKFDQPFL